MVGLAGRLMRVLELRRTAVFMALLAMLTVWTMPLRAQEKSALEQVRHSGILKVALYKNFAPFSHDGKGVDVDIANVLAAKLGVKASLLWFDADENMEDDLRNMVWKGHYLGYGPADVMMHVPVDRDYIAKVDKVAFFAPYHRERYAFAIRVDKLAKLESLDVFERQLLALEGDTLATSIMLSADSGRYRNQLKLTRTAAEAVAALKSGAVDAALAQQGELEGGVAGDARFAIDLPPHPVLQKRQWALGLAVKSGSKDLAGALQKAMNELLADGTVKRLMQQHGVVHRAP